MTWWYPAKWEMGISEFSQIWYAWHGYAKMLNVNAELILAEVVFEKENCLQQSSLNCCFSYMRILMLGTGAWMFFKKTWCRLKTLPDESLAQTQRSLFYSSRWWRQINTGSACGIGSIGKCWGHHPCRECHKNIYFVSFYQIIVNLI